MSATAPYLHGTPSYSQYGSIGVATDAIHLGKGQPHQQAALWSRHPNTQSEWQAHVKVRISGDKNSGDGLAFWYTKDGHQTGPVMGGADHWTGLAIIIDTFDDDNRGNNPAIMGIMNQGSTSYNTKMDGEGQYFGGCLRSVKNLSQPFYLRITYMRGSLKVELDDSKQGKEYVNCFEKAGIELPPGYFFGISAATGDIPDGFELLDLQIYGAEPMDKPFASSAPAPANNHIDKDGLGDVIEGLIQRQLKIYMPKIISGHSEDSIRQHSVALTTLEERIRTITDQLNNIQNNLGGLQASLTKLNTASLSDNLHVLGEDVRVRLDALHTKQMQSEQAKGILANYGGYILFLIVQVALLATFTTVKARLDRREKKWM